MAESEGFRRLTKLPCLDDFEDVSAYTKLLMSHALATEVLSARRDIEAYGMMLQEVCSAIEAKFEEVVITATQLQSVVRHSQNEQSVYSSSSSGRSGSTAAAQAKAATNREPVFTEVVISITNVRATSPMYLKLTRPDELEIAALAKQFGDPSRLSSDRAATAFKDIKAAQKVTMAKLPERIAVEYDIPYQARIEGTVTITFRDTSAHLARQVVRSTREYRNVPLMTIPALTGTYDDNGAFPASIRRMQTQVPAGNALMSEKVAVPMRIETSALNRPLSFGNREKKVVKDPAMTKWKQKKVKDKILSAKEIPSASVVVTKHGSGHAFLVDVETFNPETTSPDDARVRLPGSFYVRAGEVKMFLSALKTSDGAAIASIWRMWNIQKKENAARYEQNAFSVVPRSVELSPDSTGTDMLASSSVNDSDGDSPSDDEMFDDSDASAGALWAAKYLFPHIPESMRGLDVIGAKIRLLDYLVTRAGAITSDRNRDIPAAITSRTIHSICDIMENIVMTKLPESFDSLVRTCQAKVFADSDKQCYRSGDDETIRTMVVNTLDRLSAAVIVPLTQCFVDGTSFYPGGRLVGGDINGVVTRQPAMSSLAITFYQRSIQPCMDVRNDMRRAVFGSSYPLICIYATAEGDNVGKAQQMSMGCYISHRLPAIHRDALVAILLPFAVQDMQPPIAYVRLWVDAVLLGFTAAENIQRVKDLVSTYIRENDLFTFGVTASVQGFDIVGMRELNVNTDFGRLLMFMATEKARQLSGPEAAFLFGERNDGLKVGMHRHYREDITNVVSLMRLGLLVLVDQVGLTTEQGIYLPCESAAVSLPIAMDGATATSNHMARLKLGTKNKPHATGVLMAECARQRMIYPQAVIAPTNFISACMNVTLRDTRFRLPEELMFSQNVIAAFTPIGGKINEDGQCMNQASAQRGLMMSESATKMSVSMDGTLTTLCFPPNCKLDGRGSKNGGNSTLYNKIDPIFGLPLPPDIPSSMSVSSIHEAMANGFTVGEALSGGPRPSRVVECSSDRAVRFLLTGEPQVVNMHFGGGDVVFGHMTFDKDTETWKNTSVSMPRHMSGILTSLTLSRGTGVVVITAHFRSLHIADEADKMSSFQSQKGVLSIPMPSVDMPWAEDGTLIDFILNPQAIGRRKTIGELFQLVFGRIYAETGDYEFVRFLAERVADQLHMTINSLLDSNEFNPDLFGDFLEVVHGIVGDTAYKTGVNLDALAAEIAEAEATKTPAEVKSLKRKHTYLSDLRSYARRAITGCWQVLYDPQTGEPLRMKREFVRGENGENVVDDGNYCEAKPVLIGPLPIMLMRQTRESKQSQIVGSAPLDVVRRSATGSTAVKSGRMEVDSHAAVGASHILRETMNEGGDGVEVNYCRKCKQIMCTDRCNVCGSQPVTGVADAEDGMLRTSVTYATLHTSAFLAVAGCVLDLEVDGHEDVVY